MPPPKLTPEDFKVPPLPPLGDGRKDKIHLAAGRSIHQWEVVEHHLGGLFGTVLGTAIPVGALRAFGTMSAFSMRQKMLLEAAEAFFHYSPNEELQRSFTKLVKNICASAAARRNEIAHGIVVFSQGVDGRNGHFLVPSFHSTHKRDFDSSPSYEYTSKEIEYFTGKFRLLAGEVHRLGLEVDDWRVASLKKRRERQHPLPEGKQ